tara:strand:- start:324 stop:917 length:594 start_codon:yes stop_codon:yes gene_type:complete
MTTSKEYSRTCELCEFTCRDRSNWSKHKRTIKHLYEELKIENINLRVENEKLKQGGNTIINIDNSTNIIINVSKDAINLDDLSEPDFTRNLVEQITKEIFNLDQDKRPIYSKNETIYAKNNDVWFKGSEAEDTINKFGRRVQHKGIGYINTREEELMKSDSGVDEYMRLNENVYAPIDTKTLLHKNKEKFKTKLNIE